MVTNLRRLAVVFLLGSTLAWRCGAGEDPDAGAGQDSGPLADGGGTAGAAGANAAEIRDIVSSGESKVLEGTLP